MEIFDFCQYPSGTLTWLTEMLAVSKRGNTSSFVSSSCVRIEKSTILMQSQITMQSGNEDVGMQSYYYLDFQILKVCYLKLPNRHLQ